MTNNIQTYNALADFLGLTTEKLSAILFNSSQKDKYRFFEIPKKTGGSRKILAPNIPLREIQRKLNKFFYEIYKPSKASHGFVLDRNIRSNALQHCEKRIIYNIDIKDFFPSINFGRVRGLFLNTPFCFNNRIASTLANICTHNNYLPQGAPTSPIISNLICHRLDLRLIDIAKQHYCRYSRYADDITFSSTKNQLPEILIRTIKQIIIEEGFEINDKKERIENYFRRQEVTGLTVNKKPNVKRKYVRELRAILHSWEVQGILQASYRYSESTPDYFIRSIKGKIDFVGFIKGKNDAVYLKLKNRYKILYNTLTKD